MHGTAAQASVASCSVLPPVPDAHDAAERLREGPQDINQHGHQVPGPAEAVGMQGRGALSVVLPFVCLGDGLILY